MAAGSKIALELTANASDLQAALTDSAASLKDLAKVVVDTAATSSTASGKIADSNKTLGGSFADMAKVAASSAKDVIGSLDQVTVASQGMAGGAKTATGETAGSFEDMVAAITGSMEEMRDAITTAISDAAISAEKSAEMIDTALGEMAAASRESAAAVTESMAVSADAMEATAVKADTSSVAMGAGFGVAGSGITKLGKDIGIGMVALAAGSLYGAAKFQEATASIATQSGTTVAAATKVADAFKATWGKSIFNQEEIAKDFASIAGQLKLTEGHALDAAQAMTVMKASMNLAEGSGQSLESTTQALGTVMEAYHLKVGQAAQATDVLFNVSRETGTGVSTLVTVFDRLHARLGVLAPDMAQIGGLMDDLAEHGATGARGTQVVSTAMEKLAGSTAPVANMLSALGVTVYNTTTGKFVGLTSVIGQLHDAFEKLTPSQKVYAEQTLFGSGAAQVMGQVVASGIPTFQAATEAAGKSGTAQAAAAIQAQTLADQWKTLIATLEDWAIDIGTVLIPAEKALVTAIQDVVNWLEKHRAEAIALAAVITEILGVAVASFVAAKVTAFVTGLGKMGLAVTGLGSKMVALVTTTEVTGGEVVASADTTATGVDLALGATGMGLVLVGVGVAAAELATHWSSVMGKMKDAVSGMVEGVKGLLNTLIDAFNSTVGKITGDIGKIGAAAAAVNESTSSITVAGYTGATGNARQVAQEEAALIAAYGAFKPGETIQQVAKSNSQLNEASPSLLKTLEGFLKESGWFPGGKYSASAAAAADKASNVASVNPVTGAPGTPAVTSAGPGVANAPGYGIPSGTMSMIEGFEGFQSKAYWDPNGKVWTVGYGQTQGVGAGSTMTSGQAQTNLGQSLVNSYLPAINAIKGLSQSQVEALLSFIYNTGPGTIAKGTPLGNALRAGQFTSAANLMSGYDTSGGQVLPGLVTRRAQEVALFTSGVGQQTGGAGNAAVQALQTQAKTSGSKNVFDWKTGKIELLTTADVTGLQNAWKNNPLSKGNTIAMPTSAAELEKDKYDYLSPAQQQMKTAGAQDVTAAGIAGPSQATGFVGDVSSLISQARASGSTVLTNDLIKDVQSIITAASAAVTKAASTQRISTASALSQLSTLIKEARSNDSTKLSATLTGDVQTVIKDAGTALVTSAATKGPGSVAGIIGQLEGMITKARQTNSTNLATELKKDVQNVLTTAGTAITNAAVANTGVGAGKLDTSSLQQLDKLMKEAQATHNKTQIATLTKDAQSVSKAWSTALEDQSKVAGSNVSLQEQLRVNLENLAGGGGATATLSSTKKGGLTFGKTTVNPTNAITAATDPAYLKSQIADYATYIKGLGTEKSSLTEQLKQATKDKDTALVNSTKTELKTLANALLQAKVNVSGLKEQYQEALYTAFTNGIQVIATQLSSESTNLGTLFSAGLAMYTAGIPGFSGQTLAAGTAAQEGPLAGMSGDALNSALATTLPELEGVSSSNNLTPQQWQALSQQYGGQSSTLGVEFGSLAGTGVGGTGAVGSQMLSPVDTQNMITAVDEVVGGLTSLQTALEANTEQLLQNENALLVQSNTQLSEKLALSTAQTGVLAGFIPSLPHFASGGPVINTGLAMVHSGEHVVPAGGTLVSSGAHAPVVHVHNHINGNAGALIDMIDSRVQHPDNVRANSYQTGRRTNQLSGAPGGFRGYRV